MSDGPSGPPGADVVPAGAEPSTAVVVVNWNGGDLLLDCLRSLVEAREVAARQAPGSAVEIVLVDNGSTDGSVEEAERTFPGVRVLRLPTNGGFAAGVNAGIEATASDFVVLVNNDAVVDPNFLRAITAPMTRPGGEDVGAVTGRVLLAGDYRPAAPGESGLTAADGSTWVRVGPGEAGVRLLNSTGNVVTRSGNGGDRDWLAPAGSPPAAADVFGFNGGCAALRRRALDQVGLFDAGLFMYFEDTDLSWRLRRAGWRIVHAHDAVTEHQHAASSGTATAFFQVHNARNRLLVALAQAPWPVVVRATARTLAHLAIGPHRGRTARALGQAIARTPAALRHRRATDRRATLSRRAVARWMVADR